MVRTKIAKNIGNLLHLDNNKSNMACQLNFYRALVVIPGKKKTSE